MKKPITFIVLLLFSSLFLFAEKHIADWGDLKIELFPELKGEELAVDIKITNISGKTCYIQNVFLKFEYFDDYYQRNQMFGTIIDVKDEQGNDSPYIGILGFIDAKTKWEKGEFTRLGKGKSITGHISNLFNSFPLANRCKYITIQYIYQLGVSEPVRVQLR